MLYTASHRSLALLEILAHMGESYPEQDYAIVTLEIPDESVILLDTKNPPEDWFKILESGELATLTDEWLKKAINRIRRSVGGCCSRNPLSHQSFIS